MVLLAVVLLIASAPHDSNVTGRDVFREKLWRTTFLGEYPEYEAASLTSIPERRRPSEPDPIFWDLDFHLDPRALEYLYEKRRHEELALPFNPVDHRFGGIFANDDAEISAMMKPHWCGTPLLQSTERYSVEELVLRAEHLLRAHRAAKAADDAVERVYGT